jgi:hypothetical protein
MNKNHLLVKVDLIEAAKMQAHLIEALEVAQEAQVENNSKSNYKQ